MKEMIFKADIISKSPRAQELIQKLKGQNYEFLPTDEKSFQMFVDVLELYKIQYGNLKPYLSHVYDFQTGRFSSNEYATGYPIGKIARKARFYATGIDKTQIFTEKQIATLQELGFPLESKSEFNFDLFKIVLERYKKKFGDLYVPQNCCYDIKNDEFSFGDKKGYRLGVKISAVRACMIEKGEGRHILSKAEEKELSEMGFVWKDKRGRHNRKTMEEESEME